MKKKIVFISIVVIMSIIALGQTVNENYESPFVNVVEVAAPAVVKVDTVTTTTSSYNNEEYPEFFDDFFKRFFSYPDNPQEEYKQYGLGSGFIISEDGYIVTNEHVVGGADEITVSLLDGREYKAKYIGGDEELDIAVIQISPEGEELPIVDLGDSDDINVGEWAIAIGNPLGFQHTVTVGVVSATGRHIQKPDYSGYYSNLIQTDANINPGNSGGPLLNIHGEVIGINTAIVSSDIGTTLGFAIPINNVKRYLDSLIENGEATKGYLGIYFRSITEEDINSLGLKVKKGALVTDVVDGSPADIAGIQPLDVITKVQNIDVSSSDELVASIHSFPAGSEAEITINRDGEILILPVTFGESEISQETNIGDNTTNEEKAIDEGIAAELGFNVGNIDKDQIEKYDLNPNLKGVIITSITPGKIGEMLGLSAGDVITEIRINGAKYSIGSVSIYNDTINKIMKNDYVAMIVVSNGIKTILSFKY